MKIKITITLDTILDIEYTEKELREAICKVFQCGSEIWITMPNGKEIVAIAQDAK